MWKLFWAMSWRRHRQAPPWKSTRWCQVRCKTICICSMFFTLYQEVELWLSFWCECQKNIVPFFGTIILKSFFKSVSPNIMPKKNIVPFFWNYNFEILFQKCFTKYNAKKNIVPFFWNYNFEFLFQKWFTKYNAKKNIVPSFLEL